MRSKTILKKRPVKCPSQNYLNHYLSLNKTGAHNTGERLRATMALLLFIVTPIVGVCNCSMFCCTLLYVLDGEERAGHFA